MVKLAEMTARMLFPLEVVSFTPSELVSFEWMAVIWKTPIFADFNSFIFRPP